MENREKDTKEMEQLLTKLSTVFLSIKLELQEFSQQLPEEQQKELYNRVIFSLEHNGVDISEIHSADLWDQLDYLENGLGK